MAFPYHDQSRWKDTHEDPPEKVFMSGLMMLISIAFCVLPEIIMTYLFTIIFSTTYMYYGTYYLHNFWLSCILDNLGGRIK